MNQQSRSIICGQNDVVQVTYRGERSFFSQTDIFRIADLMQKAKSASMHQRPAMTSEEAEKLFIDGVECELLRPNGHGWQKGRVKIKLEFYPDCAEAENTNLEQNGSSQSDLDGIRQLLDEQA